LADLCVAGLNHSALEDSQPVEPSALSCATTLARPLDGSSVNTTAVVPPTVAHSTGEHHQSVVDQDGERVCITTYVSTDKNQGRCSAYVSWRPCSSYTVSTTTIHAESTSAVTAQANVIISGWRLEYATPVPPKRQRLQQPKQVVPASTRPKRTATVQVASYDEKKRRTGDFKCGTGRGHKAAVTPTPLTLAGQVWDLNMQLVHLSQLYKGSQRESLQWQQKYEHLAATLAANGNDIERTAQS
jgi:hypothetical protein